MREIRSTRAGAVLPVLLANLAPHMFGEGALGGGELLEGLALEGHMLLHAMLSQSKQLQQQQACCVGSCKPDRPPSQPPFPAAGLSTHAAQRLVSLFHLLARRYSRLQVKP